MQAGPRNLITDVPGLLVGNAEDQDLKSGVTVLTSHQPFVAAVHVMGGAPGTRETDLLAPDKLVRKVDALVLSGGSAFGLDAASGVVAGLRAAGRGFAVGDMRVPIVPAAILFDLLNGGRKDWTDSPYPSLGRAAFDSADGNFALGSVGAGAGATTANLKGGLGSASLRFGDVTVGALVAVNSLGSVTGGDTDRFWAAPFEMNSEFGGRGPVPVVLRPVMPTMTKQSGEATTIAIVATDAALDKAQATRMAVAAHDGLARAIVPSHTLLDGDLVFAAATGAVPLPDEIETQFLLGHAAALCLSRAVARAVYHATPHLGDRQKCWRELHGQ